jgi:hypothetical protein
MSRHSYEPSDVLRLNPPPSLEANWAGRGFTHPGPQGQDLGTPGSGTAADRAALQDATPGPRPSPRCPLHMWNGRGHSGPFRDCPGDREAGS